MAFIYLQSYFVLNTEEIDSYAIFFSQNAFDFKFHIQDIFWLIQ